MTRRAGACPSPVGIVVSLISMMMSVPSVRAAELSTSADTVALQSAEPAGLGPLSLPSLYSEIPGAASVYGGARPDLFVVAAERKSGTLLLYRWLRDSPDGVPVFGEPREISAPIVLNGTIFEMPDGEIHGLWLDGKAIVRADFDRSTFAFRENGRVILSITPRSVAAFPNEDGSVDIAVELTEHPDSGEDSDVETDRSSPDWRPYDAAGISTEPARFSHVVGFRLPGFLRGPAEGERQISPVRNDAYYDMRNLARVDVGPDRPAGLVAGTRMGSFYYYPDPFGSDAPRRLLMADPDGIAIRHPSIAPVVCAYPRADGRSDLIAAGEGGIHYYRFENRFTDAGAPIYEKPRMVLQENADLFPGKLPALSVADWTGNGAFDIIAGNSEGFVVLFKNVGTTDEPKFLSGERIQSDGADIHIQAGYSGSVQGLKEARWGYVSPTVVDWNGDGLPDIVMGDITGDYTVYLNRGTKEAPELGPALPLYCDGVPLHGMWRSRAAVAELDGRMAMVIVDGEDHFHLYWKVDNQNVDDGGKLTLADGSLIETSFDPAGGTGRCKLDFFDYDGDGVLDLIIGTGRRSAIPDKETGYPMPMLGNRTLGTPLFMKNVGSNAEPMFARPQVFSHANFGLVQPGGSHETGAIATPLGGDGPNLLVASETGELFLLRKKNLSLLTPEQAATYRDRRNPLPRSEN